MATLLELKEEILKERKIRRKAWRSRDYDILRRFTASPDDIFANDWELEPLPNVNPNVKKKITMYQFIFKHRGNERLYVSAGLYEREEHFNNIITDSIIIKKIPHEIEIEE